MNKVVVVAGMEVRHGLSNMGSHLPRLTWLWPPLSAQSVRAEANIEPKMKQCISGFFLLE